MIDNHIPPQAYTREDVAKAYVWVQSQPDYVKNMATSKETLVALYLQARRNGIASLENIAPVSSRDFKNQLQSLANELNQFEKPKESMATPSMRPTPQQVLTTPEFAQNPKLEIQETYDYQPKVQEQYNERSIELKVSEKRTQPDFPTLDPRSQQIVNHVKSALNLESDQEVIRMLLTLGYEKVKSILPNRS